MIGRDFVNSNISTSAVNTSFSLEKQYLYELYREKYQLKSNWHRLINIDISTNMDVKLVTSKAKKNRAKTMEVIWMDTCLPPSRHVACATRLPLHLACILDEVGRRRAGVCRIYRESSLSVRYWMITGDSSSLLYSLLYQFTKYTNRLDGNILVNKQLFIVQT